MYSGPALLWEGRGGSVDYSLSLQVRAAPTRVVRSDQGARGSSVRFGYTKAASLLLLKTTLRARSLQVLFACNRTTPCEIE